MQKYGLYELQKFHFLLIISRQMRIIWLFLLLVYNSVANRVNAIIDLEITCYLKSNCKPDRTGAPALKCASDPTTLTLTNQPVALFHSSKYFTSDHSYSAEFCILQTSIIDLAVKTVTLLHLPMEDLKLIEKINFKFCISNVTYSQSFLPDSSVLSDLHERFKIHKLRNEMMDGVSMKVKVKKSVSFGNHFLLCFVIAIPFFGAFVLYVLFQCKSDVKGK